MAEIRQVSDFRELKGGTYYSLEIKPVFLDPSCLIFVSQRRAGNSEFRCRTFWAGDFPFAFS